MHPLRRTAVEVLVVVSLLPVPLIANAVDAEVTNTKPHPQPKRHRRAASAQHPDRDVMRGKASYYAHGLDGRKTASGERYDPNAMTAAHRTLPLGTQLKVTNPKTDKSVVVTVNDRGPVPKDRMVDLSNAAAKELGMTKTGTAQVETEVVGKKDGKTLDPDDAKR
jgi:rare lipoprotein A (peptidoglycan hydrolase)